MSAIIYDTETTGIDPGKDRVIQHAYLTVGFGENGRLIRSDLATLHHFSSAVPISYAAMAVHHISEAVIAEHTLFDTTDIPPCDYLIGQNVDFDWKMVGKPEVRRICTLAIARAVYPDASGHSLGAIYLMQRNGTQKAIDALKNAHDAAVDVALTFDILDHMLKAFRPDITNMEALWQWSERCRIPTRWGFGKYKGQPIDAADRGYMLWYLRQEDQDEYTALAIRQAMHMR